MIAAWQAWNNEGRAPTQHIARALTAYRRAAHHTDFGKCHLYSTAQPDAARSPACPVVFHGHLHDPAALAACLGVEELDPATLYHAALQKWGERADAHLIGNYAAIAAMPDGCIRLSRSPWDAPPLYYANDASRVVASPLLRVLFAGGAAKQLDYNFIIDQLAYDFRHGDDSCVYRGIKSVPLGAIVSLQPDAAHISRWYSPDAIARSRPLTDEEGAEQALHLLREACNGVSDSLSSSALALSGGLDSSLTASCLIEAMAPTARLKTVTFGPDPQWSGEIAPGLMGDEIPLVRAFAAMHPQLEIHLADPAKAGFDFRAREMMAAMQIFVPGLANVGMFHGVYEKARDLGCDTLLTADLANQSFSDDGRWAYAEYARNGKWGELARLLANRPGDNRPFWRKALALSVIPHLPAAARAALRAIVHPERRDMLGLLTPLSNMAIRQQAQRAQRRGTHSAWRDFSFPRSRREAAEADYIAADDASGDVYLAFEEIYGIRRRDVTAYRPLIEFCLSLQTRHFASGGEERRLARTMAKGRMPEAQRMNRDYGQHNADWHIRIGRRRHDLLAATETMRGHPFLNETLDIDRLQHLLRDWPDRPALDINEDWPRMLAIPRAILAAQFVAIAEGRNDL